MSNQLDFDTLSEAYNSSIASVHIRFKATCSVVQGDLDLLMKRICAEFFEEGFCTNALFDLHNYRMFGKYPFAAPHAQVKIASEFNPDVFITEGFICNTPLSPNSHRFKDSDMFRLLYNEQFVYRFSMLLFAQKQHRDIVDIIHHVIINANLAGAILLSIEVEGSITDLNMDALAPSVQLGQVPKEGQPDVRNSPFSTSSKREGIELSYLQKEGTTSIGDSYSLLPVNNLVPDPNNGKLVEGEMIRLQNGTSIEFMAELRVVEGNSEARLFSTPSNLNNPIWVIENRPRDDDQEVISIRLIAYMKAPENIKEWVSEVNGFPIFLFWGLDHDTALVMPLAISDFGYMADWVSFGLLVTMDFSEDGSKRYIVCINEESDSEIEEVVCCVGSFETIKTFLNELKDTDPNESSIEEIVFIGEKAGSDNLSLGPSPKPNTIH